MRAKYSDAQLWMFLDDDYKKTIDKIREILGYPMVCNQHSKGLHQRGCRCNICPLVAGKKTPYLSAHVLGKGGDFSMLPIKDVDGQQVTMSAEQARAKIQEHADELLYPIRLENGVSWLHVDVYDNGKKIYLFNP